MIPGANEAFDMVGLAIRTAEDDKPLTPEAFAELEANLADIVKPLGDAGEAILDTFGSDIDALNPKLASATHTIDGDE
jgi:hypothetical protein